MKTCDISSRRPKLHTKIKQFRRELCYPESPKAEILLRQVEDKQGRHTQEDTAVGDKNEVSSATIL